jgi:3',5'-cyclic AMP phosphodiesterase CpdA
MKKILHLSDFHIGYLENNIDTLFERLKIIVDNAIFVLQPANEYIILITGDLINNAFVEQYWINAQTQINKLKSAGFTVLVVPGNHDYGFWGNFEDKKFIDIFKRTYFGTENIEYPKLDIIDEIAFVGLDSMAEELTWHSKLFANGKLGKDQLQHLENILLSKDAKECKYRVVYLHHHPFDPVSDFHCLDDSEDLGQSLQNCRNVDALLYGHNHAGKKANTHWGITRCLDAGSATRKDDKPGYYRIIDLSKDPRYDYDADLVGNI